MSQDIERLFVAPAREDLATALREAARATEVEGTPGKSWLAVARQALGPRQGHLCWQEAPRGGLDRTGWLTLSWWTDPQGHRHVRLRGGKKRPDDRVRHVTLLDEDARLPLWHVYPDRVFRRDGQCVVACACGVAGSVEALAWRGDRCGPCHDRREEGLPAIEGSPADTIGGNTARVRGLALSPDGRAVAYAPDGRQLLLHDLAQRRERVLRDTPEDSIKAVSFSDDGQLLAITDSAAGGVVALVDLAGQKFRTTLLHSAWEGGGMTEIDFSPDGSTLAAVCFWAGLKLWQRDGERWLPPAAFPGVLSFGFAPDSSAVALGRHEGEGEVLRREGLDWKLDERYRLDLPVQQSVLLVDLAADRRSLVALTCDVNSVAEDGTRPGLLVRHDLGTGQTQTLTALHNPMAAGLSPDGRFVAWVAGEPGGLPTGINFWDVTLGRRAGTLEWDPEEPLAGLAFSADGRTLATGGAGGTVKLWPWRQLLEA